MVFSELEGSLTRFRATELTLKIPSYSRFRVTFIFTFREVRYIFESVCQIKGERINRFYDYNLKNT